MEIADGKFQELLSFEAARSLDRGSDNATKFAVFRENRGYFFR